MESFSSIIGLSKHRVISSTGDYRFIPQPRSTDFCGRQGTIEEIASLDAVADQSMDILVEYTSTYPPDDDATDFSQPALMRGVVSF